MIDKARILITGATGFVGSHLARRQVASGAEVGVMARSSSDGWRINDIAGELHWLQADLADEAAVSATVCAFRPRIIYHCAAFGAYADMQDQTLAIAKANVMGTLNLLAAAMEVGFDLFVNTGSSGEYGICDRPMAEDMLPVPVNSYGASKTSACMFCSALARAHGLPIMTLRIFSPYGPMDDRRRLIPKVIDTLLAGEEMRLSTGDEARDYFYIDDLIDLYLRLPERAQPWRGEVLNGGWGRQTTIRDIVETVVRLTGSRSPLRWGTFPARDFDNSIWVADPTRVRAEFQWEPRIGLEEGLARTIAWHRDNPPVGTTSSKDPT